MVTVDELLSFSDGVDETLVIDNNLRHIHIPDSVKHLGVMSDDEVLRLQFKMPRFYKGLDLSDFTVRINYLNAQKAGDVYPVKDKLIDGDYITFSWLIGRFALAVKGNVIFNVCCKLTEGSGENAVIKKEFNTEPATLPVLEGLETIEQVIQAYPDLVQTWQEELFGRFDGRIDPTLTIAGQAADAAETGKRLSSVSTDAMKRVREVERALETERKRIDKFATLSAGSTTGDAELMDIRTGARGKTYSNAGEAVREQIADLDAMLTEDSPLNFLSINAETRFRGSSTGIDGGTFRPRTSLVDVAAYQSSNKTSGTSYACSLKLVDPIPVFSGKSKYYAVIKSSQDGYVRFRLSTRADWGPTTTVATTIDYKIHAGINVINLDFTGYQEGSTEKVYQYVIVTTPLLDTVSEFEVYITPNGTMLEYYDELLTELRSDLMYFDIKQVPNVYNHDLEATATYESSLLTLNVPARETEDGEWRFTIASFDLGTDLTGKKLLVRRNTNNLRTFGVGTSAYSWGNKNFPTDKAIHLIDLEEFISDNPTLSAHTGHFYLVMGTEFGNQTNTVTSTSSRSESVNVLEIVGSLDSINPLARLAGFDPANYISQDDLVAYGDYITCWGDSLTAGAGWTDTLAELSGMPVYNGGTGGEGVRTIVARQGADTMVINDITIPATKTPIVIADRSTSIPTELGYTASPLLQGGPHVNPCYIGELKGTLTWTGSNYADMTGKWTFTRSEAGEAVVINRPTALRTDFDINKNAPYLMVIFIGQNGGYSTVDELVRLHKLMIEHADACHVIVLGLSSGTAASRAEYEQQMRAEFGRYFISLRDYLSKYGLADAGLTPTEDDLAKMAVGQVPQQLLVDTVHYTAACKTVIGNMLYKKCRELGIFNDEAEVKHLSKPIKGKDYWTDSDITAITSDVNQIANQAMSQAVNELNGTIDQAVDKAVAEAVLGAMEAIY